jgi:hypothetical protein
VAFVALGITQNELNDLYKEFVDDEKVIAALESHAAEKNVDFSLKDNVETVRYEIKAASKAHNEWQPSKVSFYLTFYRIGSKSIHRLHDGQNLKKIKIVI